MITRTEMNLLLKWLLLTLLISCALSAISINLKRVEALNNHDSADNHPKSSSSSSSSSSSTTNNNDNNNDHFFRIDCHPEPNGSEYECLRRGCSWQPNGGYDEGAIEGQPSCFFPPDFSCFEIKLTDNSGGCCEEFERGSTVDKHDTRTETIQNEPKARQQESLKRNGRPFSDFNDANNDNDALADDSEGYNRPIDGYDRDARQTTVLNSFSLFLVRKSVCPASGFPDDAKRLKVQVSIHRNSLINIKISEPGRRRFVPSLPEINLPKNDGSFAADRLARNVSMSMNMSSNNSYSDSNRKHDYFVNQASTRLKIGQLFVVELQTVESTTGIKSNGVLKVIHKISGSVLFETDLGKLIYSRQFIQMPTYLPSSHVYGLGQHLGESLRKSSGRKYANTYTMFNYGHPPQSDGRAAYSSYPFYINLAQLYNDDNSSYVGRCQQTGGDDGGSGGGGGGGGDGGGGFSSCQMGSLERQRKLLATGALMLNSNAMDVLLHSNVGDAKRAGITWRLVGGIVDLYLFLGPTPNDVIGQYQELVGRPTVPPAWTLGYHQSRHNYRDLMAIKLAWARTRSAGIPMESIWTDLEFLWRTTSYTVNNPELNEFVLTLQKEFDMHYVPIVDPAISLIEESGSYEALRLAMSMDLFASYAPIGAHLSGEYSIAAATTWTDSKLSGLLDFTHPDIERYLELILTDYKKELNFDAIWLDMNEPEVFDNERDEQGEACPYDEELVYQPGGQALSERTLCMAAEFWAGKHFDLHNLYAFYQSKAHYAAQKVINQSKRPFVLSRAQFIGQGKYSGTWLGDLGSNFGHLHWSVLGIVEANWFGQPMVGADICGFFGTTTNELCARWFSLGAFYPFARNHNDGSSRNQDPGSLNATVQEAARVALMKRYSLLPYLYSLFYDNYLYGLPVIRTPVFEFFNKFDKFNLTDLPKVDDQFMWGSALMIAPILKESVDSRSVYLAPGRWYDVTIGLPGTNTTEGPYETSKSNWPLVDIEGLELSYQAQKRLDRLLKPIDCPMATGCWLEDQYTPLGSINVYLKGGQIIPTFRFVEHTKSVGMLWKNASFFLEIALSSSGDAVGWLYWDNGESDLEHGLYSLAQFWATDGHRLLVAPIQKNPVDTLRLSGFLVYGVKSLSKPIKDIFYGNMKLVCNYNSTLEVLNCSFKSPENGESDSIELNQFERIEFSW